VIDAAVQQAKVSGTPRSLDNYVLKGLRTNARWIVAYAPPPGTLDSQVLAVVPYGRGQRAVAVQRF
jgi:hypothetical protein